MLTYRFLLKRAACSVAVLALAATAATAAPDVTISDAKIAAGKLVITGKSAASRMKLRLDGKSGADFNVTSGADKSFSFSVAYVPRNCVVKVERLLPSSKVGTSTDVAVAGCSANSISAQGTWRKNAKYEALDVVTHGGSSWLARRDNAGTEPSEGSDWQLFAAGSDAEESSGDDSADQGGADAAASDAADAERVAQRAPPTGPAGGDLNGTYPNPSIRAGAVVANKIAAGAVVTNKIANNAVTNTKILAGAVGTNKIANNAVTTLKILDAAITTNKIANDAVASGRIAPGAVINSRLAADAVTTDKILDGTIISADILDGTITGADVLDETLTALDLAVSSVGQSEIATDGVAASEIANDAIDSGEIVDFGLSNQDVGVLFAEVSAAGVLDNSSGSVTVVKLGGLGSYEVDFARNITLCTAVATVGPSSAGSALGEVNVADRGGNAEAVFVDTNNSDGTAADKPFRLVVVC